MVKRMTLKILTPTYNRKETIPKLYASLTSQTCHDFVWNVIDDGSTDGTEAVIKEWMEEGKINISYLKKENGGKHTALNIGIKDTTEDLIFIVDSDDYLTPDAVETILSYAEKYEEVREEKKLCGFCFLRHYSNGEVNTAYFPRDEYVENYVETRINGNIGGDKAEVFYTSALKKFPFKEYEGEKFMPEDAVWLVMSREYDMVNINKGIYICDYLEGGLTRSGRAMKIHSPRGMMLRSKEFMNDNRVCLKARIKMTILYVVYSRFAGMKPAEAAVELKDKKWFYCLYLPSALLQLRWKKQLGK